MMFGSIYPILRELGYTHPLHPVLTHLPVGLVIGGFFFGFAAALSNQKGLYRTAHHCVILALIALVPTAALGYMDWKTHFGGAWIAPIKMKLILAGILFLLLLFSALLGRRAEAGRRGLFAFNVLSLATALLIGYYGGELVYGKHAHRHDVNSAAASTEGAEVFGRRCSTCHYPDRVEVKIGPGLKGIYKRDALPVSGRPVTDANIRLQLETPFKSMPSFSQLPEKQVEALIQYLKTL